MKFIMPIIFIILYTPPIFLTYEGLKGIQSDDLLTKIFGGVTLAGCLYVFVNIISMQVHNSNEDNLN